MEKVEVRQLVKKYGNKTVVNDLDLTVERGEFMVFLGPSGCGKTTTLRCIAGLEIPDAGAIRIGERDVTRLPPADRDIAFVFQSFSLYPHLSVYDNLAFPLRAVGTAQSEIDRRVRAAAATLHIERLLDRKPDKLSGGEQQRVTIGRAIVRRPKVFLMDEPLSALDAKLRTDMRAEIKRLQTDLEATTVYVTHDQLEAMSMGDKIAIMEGGVLQQVGTPADVYDRPANRFVAEFIGSPAMNLLPVVRGNSGLRLEAAGDGADSATIPVGDAAREVFHAASPETQYVFGVRPEDVTLAAANTPGTVPGDIYVAEWLGAEKIITVRVAGHLIKLRTGPTFPATVGDAVGVRFDLSRAHLFPHTDAGD